MARFCFPAILQQTLGKSPKLLPSVPFSSVTMLTLSLQSALRPVNTVRDKTTYNIAGNQYRCQVPRSLFVIPLQYVVTIQTKFDVMKR